MNVCIDIETIPDQTPGAKEVIAETLEIKCPLKTKGEIGQALNMSDKDIKFTSKDDLELRWIKEVGERDREAVAEEAWRKTSFDPTKGEIVSIGWKKEKGDARVEYRQYQDRDEPEFLLMVRDYMAFKGNNRPPFFVGHNVTFDLEFLYKKFVIHGVNPGFSIPFSGRHKQHYYCTMEAWAGYNKRISQDALCEILGLPKKPGHIDGSKVWDYVRDGKVKEVAEYNLYDVETVEKIYNQLNFTGE